MINFYSAPTPNGWKVSMALEEMEIDYNLLPVDLSKGEQHDPDFLELSPNGRIPAIHDEDTDIRIFESGAILLYLAEKSGKLMPLDTAGRYEVMQLSLIHISEPTRPY